jgi:hypothetical protein
MISRRLRIAVKHSSYKQYELAQAIVVHPSTLSAWLVGIAPVRDGDRRILQLGAILGVPAKACFSADAGRRQFLRRHLDAAMHRSPRRLAARDRGTSRKLGWTSAAWPTKSAARRTKP